MPATSPSITNSSPQELQRIYQLQKRFFSFGETRKPAFRRQILAQLKAVVQKHEEEILAALAADFAKPRLEAYASEIGFLYAEIDLAIKKLKGWSQPRKVATPLTAFPSRSYIYPEPKGVCLVIAPWNYPFQLMLAPAVAALAAGNVVMIKAPEQSPALSLLTERIIKENFDAEILAVVQGEGHIVVPQLMQEQRFDHVFFTGSVPVGRKIAQMAADQLVPVTLELGGKSPAVVGPSAKLKLAAQRIAFGKWLNAGQTCVAPDYLLLHESIAEEFLRHLIEALQEFYPEGALASESYTSMVHAERFRSVLAYLQQGEVLWGGDYDEERRRIAPTLLAPHSLDQAVMKEEIFGPILPVIRYRERREAIDIIARNPDPLSFYLFSEEKSEQDQFLREVRFGGGAINNTVIHLTNPNLPFGGVGDSGIGSYHGRFGFDCFSHYKSVMKSGTWFDLKQKYPPYSNKALQLIRWILG